MKNRVSYLDALRGVAIFGVFTVHATYNFMAQYKIDHFFLSIEKILVSGMNGVILFFMISSYGLYLSFEEQKKNGSYSIRDYFVRRIFRIVPLYFVVLTSVAFFSSDKISFFDLLGHYFFVNGFFEGIQNNIIGVEWTMSVEWFFYFILPYLIFSMSSKEVEKNVFLVSLAVSLVCTLLGIYTKSDYWHFLPLKWIAIFYLGVYAYKFHYDVTDNTITFRSKDGYYHYTFAHNVKYKKYYPWVIFLALPYIVPIPFAAYAYAFIFFVLLLYLKQNNSPFLMYKAIIFLGNISFSMYLIHMPIIHLVASHDLIAFTGNKYMAFIAAFIITFVLAFLASVFLYATIEKNGMLLGKYVIKKFKIKEVAH